MLKLLRILSPLTGVSIAASCLITSQTSWDPKMVVFPWFNPQGLCKTRKLSIMIKLQFNKSHHVPDAMRTKILLSPENKNFIEIFFHYYCSPTYSWFHIKGTWSVHSYNGDYLYIPGCGYLFHETPSSLSDPKHFVTFWSTWWVVEALKVVSSLRDVLRLKNDDFYPIDPLIYIFFSKKISHLDLNKTHLLESWRKKS